MKKRTPRPCAGLGSGLVGLVLAASGALAYAADQDAVPTSVDMLKERIEEQSQQIELLKRSLAQQQSALDEMRRSLDISGVSGRGATPATSATAAPPPATTAATATAPPGAARPPQVAQAPQPVGQAPERRAGNPPPAVAPIFEQPGVLTPRDKWIVEPSLQYAYSSTNRIALIGYTIIPALLIGLIDVREVKSNSLIAGLTVRRGITNRFELEAKVPYVYRWDSSVSREFIGQGASQDSVFDTDGNGIGDVELTGRYQLNDGGADKPYYIASLRFKTRTGKDPFEVETNRTLPGGRGTGLQTELPTGSGFYSLQPGLTVLVPSDPVVFFGGASYQYSFKRTDVSRKTDGPTGEEFIGDIQPGGAFGFNFGMGLALNERSSFSIGYDHLSVGKIKINDRTAPTSVRVQLGTLLLGYSYRLNPGRTLNLSLGAGLTRDTPDLQLTLRMPMTL
jgi:hypothetical protein